MSTITVHERPGVYSSYEASALTAGSSRGKTVAVVAAATLSSPEDSYYWNSYSRAAADVGECTLSHLAQLALRNGAGAVYGVPVTGVVARGNVYGTQFHPEKSGDTGLMILRAFKEISEGAL